MRLDEVPPLERPRSEVPSLGMIRRAIDELLRLESQALAPPSPLGGMTEALALGLVGDDDSHLWRRTQTAERRQERFALLLMAWGRLGTRARAVIYAKVSPRGYRANVVEIRGGECGDLVHWQRDGYDVIGNADAPGYVRMKGAEPIFPTNAEIAQALGLSTDQVRRAVSRAYAVFRVWLTDPEEDETA